ncbi:MAG: hypothetical protein QG622_3182 [Actinomycetota bacterium]|nr:hypothetical protein [Actinomycetota bacterium]
MARVRICEDVAGPEARAGLDLEFAATFERLSVRGEAAVLQGAHQRDVPPGEGGRWGLSAVALFDEDTATLLDEWSSWLRELAGPGHWLTGVVGSAHATVRAVQPHRPGLTRSDSFAGRVAAATERAAAACSGPVVFRLRGVALTSACVMACLYPVDGAAGALAAAVRAELGPDDGWLEEEYVRTIWYSSLLHFTQDVKDPRALVEWVRERRQVKGHDVLATTLQAVTFDHVGDRMLPRSLGGARLPAC